MSVYKLSDAKQFFRDNTLNDLSTRGARLEVRLANQALAYLRLGMGAGMQLDRKLTRLSFAAQNTTGLVSIGVNKTTISGNVSVTYDGTAVGRYIYFGSDLRSYLVAAYSAPAGVKTLELAETYKGVLPVSTNTSFVLSDERQILPTDFKELADADQGSQLYYMEALAEVSDAYKIQARLKMFDVPKYYAVEFESDPVSNDRRAYLRVFPPPVQAVFLDVWYYGGPAAVSVDGDKFGLPDTPEAQLVIEAYLMAVLQKHKGAGLDRFNVMIAEADQLAKRYRGNMQAVKVIGERDMYSGPASMGMPYRAKFADGIIGFMPS